MHVKDFFNPNKIDMNAKNYLMKYTAIMVLWYNIMYFGIFVLVLGYLLGINVGFINSIEEFLVYNVVSAVATYIFRKRYVANDR